VSLRRFIGRDGASSSWRAACPGSSPLHPPSRASRPGRCASWSPTVRATSSICPKINAALRLPDIQQKAHLFGLDARGTTPDEMAQRMRSDVAKWALVIEKAGLEKQ
jgi:hypothetical protein